MFKNVFTGHSCMSLLNNIIIKIRRTVLNKNVTLI